MFASPCPDWKMKTLDRSALANCARLVLENGRPALGSYERGLANLKQYAESVDLSEFSQIEIERVNVISQDILFVSSSSSQESTDVARAMAVAYAEISTFMSINSIKMTGQPMAITRAWQEGGYQFDAAIPVDFIPAELSGKHAGCLVAHVLTLNIFCLK